MTKKRAQTTHIDLAKASIFLSRYSGSGTQEPAILKELLKKQGLFMTDGALSKACEAAGVSLSKRTVDPHQKKIARALEVLETIEQDEGLRDKLLSILHSRNSD